MMRMHKFNQQTDVYKDFYMKTQIGKNHREERKGELTLLRITVKFKGEFFYLQFSDLNWFGPF